MNAINKIVYDFIFELLKTDLADYEEIKVALLCMYANKKDITNFLYTAFSLVEKERTPLIGMKGGAA